MGISSPSKVFAQIGRDTGRGFIKGLAGTAAQIKETTERLAKQITDAFRSRKTRVDDRLVAMLRSGNKRLQGLAAQRDKLVQRIAYAQKSAADTSKAARDAFSLQNLTQDDPPVTIKGLAAGLQNAVDQVRRFTAQINNLARRGLFKDLLAQIIGLGPQAGSEIATVLSRSTKDSLKRRRALRIKSPSLVMRRLGEMTGLGLERGLLGRITALEAASRRAAQSLVRGVSSHLTGLAGATPALGGGTVVPLTRSQRLRQSGLDPAALGERGGDVIHNHHWGIREVGDSRVTAQRVLNRFVLAAGVTG
ncbi:hypothetical protein [Streptomyces sp. CC224B]|uniref:hypothetical protein n=1 Tax=Streptomyces sp. CC224B TaxID=3044571 RepID=UPI0024A999F6|nr:hypothetical protein [Streptomyces sp. CC224B]